MASIITFKFSITFLSYVFDTDLIVSFFSPFAGASSLVAVTVAILAALALGFGKEQVQNGLLTYSVVLFGLGFGTNFEFGAAEKYGGSSIIKKQQTILK